MLTDCPLLRGVFELYARLPKAELLSVIPKGDTNKPKDRQK
jgi:hypothetical protein